MIKRSYLKYFSLMLMFLAGFNIANSKHIIGSEMTYECLGQNPNLRTSKVRVTIIAYRDKSSNGAELDKIINVGIYRKLSNQSYQHLLTTQEPLRNNLNDPIKSFSPCVEAPSSFEAERGFYIFELDLPWDNDYYIVYQRCCRNDNITNVVNPGGSGTAISLTISKEAINACNSSPNFIVSPRLFICVNDNLNVDNSATDVDGDSLVYEFCAPYVAGGTFETNANEDPFRCDGVSPNPARCLPPYNRVQFAGNFSATNPLLGSPGLSIDRKTGFITGKPTASGLFLIGVCVKEYRRGVLIGEILRDFQLLVAGPEACNRVFYPFTTGEDNSPDKEIVLNSFRNDTIYMKACGITDVLYRNTSIVNTTGPIRYEWIYQIGNDTLKSAEKDLMVTYPGFGTYKSALVVIPQFPECIDTIQIVMDVKPKLTADFDVGFDSCQIAPWVFTNTSMSAVPYDTVIWNFNREDTSNIFSPVFSFLSPGKKNISLLVRNRDGCIDTASFTSDYFPVPSLLNIKPDVFLACAPATVNFLNASQYITPAYDITWDYGDGNTSKSFQGVNTYKETGLYNVSLSVKSPSNCTASRTFTSLIDVKEKPVANFELSLENQINGTFKVDLTDLSKGSEFIKWQFGELTTSSEDNPSYTFTDTGTYVIIQKVFNSQGCFDTLSKVVQLRAENFLYVPDAFTPNNDQLNDDFKPKGLFRGINVYTMQVYNRYGEMIFTSTDPLYGWNGLKFNTGVPAPNDVYIYLIEYEDVQGNKQQKQGSVTLLR